MKKGSGAKTVIIVLASALLLVGLLVLAYGVLLRGNRQPQITLPTDPTPREDPIEPNQPTGDQVVSLNPDNVLDALRTLTPADSFYEALSVTILWNDGSSTHRVERYCAMGLQRITVTGKNGTRSCLSDGNTLYVWYEGDETAVSRPMDGTVNLMDLAGLPDYMEELQSAKILEADFLSEEDGLEGRIYVRALTSDGAERRYWVDLDTAQLVRADVLEDDGLTYQVLRLEQELVAPTDDLFRGVFVLPDGTQPFS